MTFWKLQNNRDNKTINSWQGFGKRKDEWTKHSQFLGETSLYDTIMVDTCPYMFVQPHKMYNEQ